MKQSPNENRPCQSELGRARAYSSASSRYPSLGFTPALPNSVSLASRQLTL